MFTSRLRKSVLSNLLKSSRYGLSSSTIPRAISNMNTCPSLQKISTHPNLGHFNHVGAQNGHIKSSILTTQFRNISTRSSSDEEFVYNRDTKEPPKLFLVQPRVRPEKILQAKLLEALNLANSLEEQREDGNYTENNEERQTPYLLVQNPGIKFSKSHADTYFGPGTVDTVKSHVDAIDAEDGLDAVFVNAILTGIQQRNLERAWGKPVFDRVGLIIEIFYAHAQTKEAKLQAELAALMYKKTRLVRVRGPDGRLTFGTDGEAEVVSGRGRASGGRGFISGAGETELQLQRRRILERRSHLLAQIEEVRRTRALQRAARQRRGGVHGRGLPVVAVVGYTNAGKSSLVAALSQSDLYVDDKLFATLDPRLRSIVLPSGQKVLLSDTVGFISDLPVQLVEAFRATLEEVTEADLLMHVIDISAPNSEEQRTSVLEVLEQIGVPTEKLENMIELWNKVDLLQRNSEDGVHVEYTEGKPSEDSSEKHQIQDRDAKIDLVEQEDTSTNIILNEENGGSCSSKGISRVETSATTGVGLQELLCLLDDRLKPNSTLEDKCFVKWRPYLC